MAVDDKITSAESGGDANAKNPNSSAQGSGQFINGTWLSVVKQHRPDLAAGKSDADILAMRADPALSHEMTGAYATDNQDVLRKAGLPVTDSSTYLAHFAGPQGAVSVMQADPNASVAEILGPKVVAANPFLKDMTAQGLQAWASKRMGVTVKSGSNAPPAAPTNTAPPIFANPQPSTIAAAPAAPMAPMVPEQQQPMAAPIFAPAAPTTNQIDLSGLQQRLARVRQSSPIFAGVANLLANKGTS